MVCGAIIIVATHLNVFVYNMKLSLHAVLKTEEMEHIYMYRFQNVFLRCPTPRLHCFLSSHWPP